MAKNDDRRQDFEFGSSHPATVMSAGTGRGLTVLAIVVAVLVLLAGYLYFFQPDRVAGWLHDTPFAPATRITVVYRWRDAAGGWQITDRPPPPGTPSERLEYRSDTNVLPLVPPPSD